MSLRAVPKYRRKKIPAGLSSNLKNCQLTFEFDSLSVFNAITYETERGPSCWLETRFENLAIHGAESENSFPLVDCGVSDKLP